MNHWCESCARKNLCYVVDARPKCFVPITSNDRTADRKTENSSENPNNCEPQTDCGDFADRLAYERGVKHAWGVAQKVFDSTVTFYEAEDVAKQIDKDINVRSKTEPQTEPNLILPERMERGERYEVGETIVVMNRDDYYDLLCKSWEDESHTNTHDEAIKAMATLIKEKDEPQNDLLVTEYPQDGEVNLIGRDKTEAVVMAYDVYKELTEPEVDCSWK